MEAFSLLEKNPIFFQKARKPSCFLFLFLVFFDFVKKQIEKKAQDLALCTAWFRPRHSIRLFWIKQLTHREKAICFPLRGRLNPQWFTLYGNPRAFGDPGFHRKFRYSCQHSHFWSLQQPLTSRLRQVTERSTTPIKIHHFYKPSLRWVALAPLHLRCSQTIDRWAITLS